MFAIERQQEILNIIKEKKSITVANLAKTFFIGEATIRRDLDKLEKGGAIKRIYGGAVLLEGLDTEIPLSVREKEQSEEKDIIGRLAAQTVQDNNIIVIDSSSTAMRMVPYLKGKDNLTVITNGAKTALRLGEMLHIKVYSTGGILRENSSSFVGNSACSFLDNFYVDAMFFSCRAISREIGISDSNEDEAILRRTMIKNAKKSFLLCDSTKFDQVSFCKIGGFDKINCVITDTKPNLEWIDFFQSHNIQFICP